MKPLRFLLLGLGLLGLSISSAESLPRILIIGDSISLGYTPYVKEMFQGRAEVIHNPGNAQHTGTGLEKIDAWVGDEKSDVIHFNWGLWDLCYRHPDSTNQGHRDKERGTLTTTLETYEANLEKLVKRLEQMGAKLVWANTSYVPDEEYGRIQGDELNYNAAAARVMSKHGIAVNDIRSLTLGCRRISQKKSFWILRFQGMMPIPIWIAYRILLNLPLDSTPDRLRFYLQAMLPSPSKIPKISCY